MPDHRLQHLIRTCSNAGRWGDDDELGTLNLITPDKRVRAARSVQEGVSVSLASNLTLDPGPMSDALVSHVVFEDPATPVAVADSVSLHVHGWSTHLDALGHIAIDGVGYGGQRRGDILGDGGMRRQAITAMRDGIFTRGVLLDVAAATDVAWLPSTHVVTRAELEQAEVLADVRVEPGDALLVHTGLSARFAAEPGVDADRRAGLGVEAVLWLHERGVAVFGGDCVERLPGADPSLPLPLHQLGIAVMGLALLDWPRLDELRSACQRFGRWTFLLTVAPLPIVGGTGSPVNPIATF